MAAKVILQEYDFSSFVPKMGGIYCGCVVASTKGTIDHPRFVTSVDDYISHYGVPNPQRGVSEYSAITYLTFGGPMYIVRAAHDTDNGRLDGEDPRYAAALVRAKVEPVPPSTVVPDPDYEPQRVVEPIKNGLTQHELDAFNFPLYKTHREYQFEDCVIMESVLNQPEIKVFSFEDLEVGDEISLTPTIHNVGAVAKGASSFKVDDTSYVNPDQYIEIIGTKIKVTDVDYDNNVITLEFPLEFALGDGTPIYIIPYDGSANYEIQALEERIVDYDVLTLDNPITADKATHIRLVKINEVHYSDLDDSYEDIVVDSVNGNVITVNTTNGVEVKQTIKVNGNEYIVADFDADNKTITVEEDSVDASNGDEITLMQRTYFDFAEPVYVVRAINASTQVIVTNADYIKNFETIAFGDGLTTAKEEAKVLEKNLYKEKQNWIIVDKPLIAYTNYRIYKMTHSEYEERDAFLVYSLNQGEWGNALEIEIAPSKIENAFYVNVYNDGVPTGEKFQASRRMMKDGFGNQLYIESVINGKSANIMVKDNPAMIDENGEPANPLYTNYSLWRKDPVDVFLPLPTPVTTIEDVLLNDVEIGVTDNSQFRLGDRIKFEGFDGEYKVLDVSEDVDGNKIIKLDRRVIVDKIPYGTQILRFAYTQYFPIVKLDKALPGYKVPCDYVLAGESGTLLDAGINNLAGGGNGSAVTIGDLMRAADQLAPDTVPVQLLLDGGFAYPAYQQKLVTIAEKKMTCFAYLTTDINAELSVNYMEDIINYRNSTMLNTSWASIFTTHVKIYDQWNMMEVWVSPEAFAAAQQSYVANNAKMWIPAAGWTYGKIKVLDLIRRFDQPELDLLTEHQINPLKYEDGDGVSIWGNETLLTMPSYLQMRHIRMFLIVLETGLKNYLKYQTFKLNDAGTRANIVFNINKWFADTLASGVYDFQILDVTNDSNINNREAVFRIIFSPKTDMEDIITQVVITSKGFDFGLVNI